MQIIEVETKSGTLLYGCLYGEQYLDTLVIITNGNCGNIFENKFLQVVGEELEKHKISFVYAHNSGAFYRLDTKTKSGQPIGNAYDMFDNCIDDLDAYIKWAKTKEYKHIILGGHSYGANKVVYYLSHHKENIDKYILISPTDTAHFKEHENKSIEELMPIAIKYKAENRFDELLPIPFDNHMWYTARAFLDFLNNKNAKNLPIYNQNGNWAQLKAISQPGLFVMGKDDSFAFGDTLNHLSTINMNSKNKDNQVVIIKDCGHTFKNKEKELAQAILNFVNS